MCMVWFFAGKDCHGGGGCEGARGGWYAQPGRVVCTWGPAGTAQFDLGALHFQGDTLVECSTYVWSDFLVVGVFVRVGVAG